MSLANVIRTDGHDAAVDLETKMRLLEKENSRLTRERDDEKRCVDLYAKAWERELGPPYVRKTWHIDALVLTTRLRLQERDEARAEVRRLQAIVRECGRS